MKSIMHLNHKEKTEYVLELAREGIFGTPEHQYRGSSNKIDFWRAFEGQLKVQQGQNGHQKAYIAAGIKFRKEQEAK